MGLEKKNIPEEDVQILSVNEEKIKKDKDNLSEVKSSKKNIYLKKTTKNIAKLTLLAVTALLEVPVVKSFVGAVGAMEANRIMGLISKIIGEISNMPLTNVGGQLIQMELYANMSLPAGQYSWVGYLINFCIQLAVDHPGKVIAGGAVLAGLLTNALIYPTIKKIVRMAKGAHYKSISKHHDSEIQLDLYDDVKKILKHKNFKKIKKHNEFSKQLDNAFKVTIDAQDYEFDLNELHDFLKKVYDLVDTKQIPDFTEEIINIETILNKIINKKNNEQTNRKKKR